jgi:hypothetical protein
MSKGYVDADGHVMEDAEDILQFPQAQLKRRAMKLRI